MPQDATEQYPGETATVGEILRLAGAYHDTARLLSETGCRKHTIARAPLHLTAIHAIELYLNALLLHAGRKQSEVRALRHCLQERAGQAQQAGLQLRKKTHKHLVAMTDNREYLVTRYEPELKTAISNINRLMTTLDEVSKKVTRKIGDTKAQK